MKPLFVLGLILALSPAAFGRDQEPACRDSITVNVVGTLQTGVVAIGAETTGTTITAKGITWELDFGNKARLKRLAETLDGKKVVLEGRLERRKGVEIPHRWIVTVSSLNALRQSGATLK